jgi:hypothetical protein
MQLTTQRLRTAKENARLGRAVDLADALEDAIPVRTAEGGFSPQTGDGVRGGVVVVDHDVGGVVGFDFGGKVLWRGLVGIGAQGSGGGDGREEGKGERRAKGQVKRKGRHTV